MNVEEFQKMRKRFHDVLKFKSKSELRALQHTLYQVSKLTPLQFASLMADLREMEYHTPKTEWDDIVEKLQ